jgi:hypothetical protein
MFLENSGQIYSSNVHLLLGNWSRIGDVNTLVDVGRDLAVPAPLADAPTAVGKRAVEQVVPWTPGRSGGSGSRAAGRRRTEGRRPDFEVLHTPGHSSAPLLAHSGNSTYEECFAAAPSEHVVSGCGGHWKS